MKVGDIVFYTINTITYCFLVFDYDEEKDAFVYFQRGKLGHMSPAFYDRLIASMLPVVISY